MTEEKTLAQPSVLKETHDSARQIARELSAALGADVELRRVYQVAICALHRRLRGPDAQDVMKYWGEIIAENGLGE